MNAAPLVSILIPAYHARFFGEAFESARAQTWPNLEIVVRDDSAGDEIERITLGARDARVAYVRNSPRLGFHANFTACLGQARGELVKFLNDDDRLHPRCVEVLAGVLLQNPSVTLATSRRHPIDERGARVADVPSTVPLAHVSAFVPGMELGNFVLMNLLNLIGEPTTTLFRRADLAVEPGGIFRWGGEEYHCLADLSAWLRLLSRGAAFYCAEALSEFRQHAGQEQAAARLECVLERGRIVRRARAAGFLAAPAQYLAALVAARSFAAATDFTRVSPDVASRVRSELAALDAEIDRPAPL